MNIKYFCIHHSPAVDRKAYLIPFFKRENIDINWIENFLPNDELINRHDDIFCEHSANGLKLNNSELSCFMKHRFAIKSFIDSDYDYAVVFEDDIEIPNFNFQDLIFKLSEKFNKQNGDIVFVGSMTGMDIDAVEFGSIFCSRNLSSRCAHCYFISKASAKKIYPFLEKIIAPFDWQLNFIIKQANLVCCWSSPHVNQRTEKGIIKSLLR